MRLATALFPVHKRDFYGKRWIKIGLRTLHLMGLAGLGGGYLYQAEAADWLPYLWLTLISGLSMLLVEAWSHGIWLLQVRGLSIFIKIGLLGWAAWLPDSLDALIALCVVFISGMISHAPGRVRYYSPFYGRVIKPENWRWGGTVPSVTTGNPE
jgi:hypothetical protein